MVYSLRPFALEVMGAIVVLMVVSGCSPRPQNRDSWTFGPPTTGPGPDIPPNLSPAVAQASPADLRRQHIWAAWHLGQLVGTLYVAEMAGNPGDALTHDQAITVRTSLDGIRSTFEEYGIRGIVLPTVEDFNGSSATPCSDAADVSTHDSVDTHFGPDPLDAYCVGRDVETLNAYFYELKGNKDRATNMASDIETINGACDALRIKARLGAASTLTADQVDKFTYELRTELEDVSNTPEK